MSRRSVVWLLTLPLAVLGSQVAHALAFRLSTRGDAELSHELAATGHGYLRYAPIALAVCAVLVVVALGRELVAVAGMRHAPRSHRLSALTFALVAPAVFVAQEHFERLAHVGAFPSALVVEPTFLVGLALQLPFALGGYLLARLLLNATHAFARLLALPPVVRIRERSRWRFAALDAPRGWLTGLALGPRGPPLLLVD